MSACGGQVTDTPNPTVVAVKAATALASLPTAESLTPRPATTLEPTATPMIPTSTPASTATPAAVAAAATSAPATTDYTVQAGDTLMSIAMNNHVSMASIMLLNDMGDSQVVKLGQVLHIPTAKTWPNEGVFWFVYIVQSGEALSNIASRFGVKIDDLVQVNQLSDASAIRVGQKLVIPVAAFTPNDHSAPEPTKSPRAEAAPDQAAAAQVSEAQTPEVKAQATEQIMVKVAAPANVAGIEGMRAQLLALYNQARTAYGRASLAGSVILQSAAQGHAEDCAQRGYGSHSGSDGSTSSTRIGRAGYPGGITGENWAWGHSAEEVFDMWFNQESDGGPHRSNILSARYAEVGFGVAAANGGFYFIADFGAP